MSKQSDERPNLILLMTDQQRGDALSIDGHPALQTPNLDALAAGGARFRRAYSTCPSCIPARRSLLSGQHPSTHGMVGMRANVEWNPASTLPQALRDAGYQTMFVGRTMHQFPRWKRYGFEEFHPSINLPAPGDSWSEYEKLLDREDPDAGGFGGHGVDWNGWVARPWHLRESLHEVHWTVAQAIRCIQQRDPSRPFFLLVSFYGPHPPLTPPEHYLQRYLRMDLPEPAMGDWANPPREGTVGRPPASYDLHLTGERLRQCHAGYFGYINYIDDQIARLFNRRCGAPPENLVNTYTFFTSDHGEMLGDHGMFRKTRPYEASARVPFLVHGPDVRSGLVSDEPVCHEDLFPTMLDFAGARIDTEAHPLDGRSLVPLLRGEVTAGVRELLHGEHAVSGWSGGEHAHHYLTDGRWKYIWFSQGGIEHLFDLAKDPTESRDLHERQPQRLARWRNALIERLADRPEGFTDGARLVAGSPHPEMIPWS